MAAITWRNIDAPSLGDPSRTLQNAQQGIGQGFATLGDVLKGYQANDAQNWEVGKQNNTDAFMAQLMSRYKTPEQLAAAQASGELDQLRAGFGAQIDQARTRDALDSRGGILQQRALTGMQYNNQVADEQIRPAFQSLMADAALGNQAAVEQGLAANPQVKARKGGEVAQALMTGRLASTNLTNAVEDQTFQRAAEGRAVEMFPLDKDAKRASTQASRASSAASNASQRLSLLQEKMTLAQTKYDDERKKLESDNLKKAGPLGDGWVGQGDSLKKLQEGISKIPDITAGESASILAEFQKMNSEGGIQIEIMKDGKKQNVRVPVSVSAALAAAAQTGNQEWNWFGTDSGRASKAVEYLKQTYSDPGFQEQLGTSMNAFKLSYSTVPDAPKEKSLKESLGFGGAASAATPAQAPGVSLPTQWQTGNQALDTAFSQELARRAKTMIPGLAVKPDGTLDPQSNPELLTQIRNQVAASLPKPSAEAQKKTLK